jgi:hypothetical protein
MNSNCINFKLFKLNTIITDGKPGELVDLDLNKLCKNINIEFNVTKYFYINELNSNLSRGNHSNSNTSEILICLNGSFEIKLDNGFKKECLIINKNEGLFIGKNIWIEFYNFKNCIILIFVDTDNKGSKDSCYDYNEFIKNVNLITN